MMSQQDGTKRAPKRVIVRLKPGFDRSLEGVAVRRARLPLSEKGVYEVLECDRREANPVLILCEVSRIHIGGVWRIIRELMHETGSHRTATSASQ